MILKTIKSANEAGFDCIEFVMIDKAITEVIIGGLHIRKGESYQKGLEVLIEAPYEKENRWKLVGTLSGFPDAISYHESRYAAEGAGALLEDHGGKIAVTCVDVLIDERGEIVSECAEESKPSSTDIPF